MSIVQRLCDWRNEKKGDETIFVSSPFCKVE